MILVTGATGRVGSETVRLLTTQHQPVRALIRNASRGPVGQIDVVVGDFDDPRTLDEATDGIDTLILISPAVPAQEIAVIDSALRKGVRHIVKITSKASVDSPVDRRRGQAYIEAHLADSAITHTLLRSNAYLQNILALAPAIKATAGFTMSTGDGRVGMIDARDVASTAAAIAVAPATHGGREYWLTGPALITYSDVADELSATLGHEIVYRRITPDEHRAAMISSGVPAEVANSNAQAFGLIAEGDAAWHTDDVESLTGRAPRSLHTFITEHALLFT